PLGRGAQTDRPARARGGPQVEPEGNVSGAFHQSPNPVRGDQSMFSCVAVGLALTLAAPVPPPRDTRAEEPAWGKPVGGLRLGLCRTEGKGEGKVRWMATLENVGDEDLVVNLGLMLGNGKKQLPTALRLIFTDADGKKRFFQRKVGGVAGRVDPF